MLRDAAIAWVRNHCPSEATQAAFVRYLAAAIERGVNCFFIIAPNLTTSGKPYLLYCFDGELFIFELSPHQAACFEIKPDQLRWIRSVGRLEGGLTDSPPISLHGFELDRPRVTDLHQPISGVCRYEVLRGPVEGHSVRLDFMLAGRANLTARATIQGRLGRSGKLRVQFPPIPIEQLRSVRLDRLTAVFIRVEAVPDPTTVAGRKPVSNAAAALMEILPNALGQPSGQARPRF